MITSKLLIPGLIILRCLLPTGLFAQLQGQALADSLVSELQSPKDDTTKIKILYELVATLAPNDNKAALDNAKKCMEISKQTGWPKGIGLSYLAFARTYYELSDVPASLENCQLAYDVFKTLNDKEYMAVALRVTGNNYVAAGYYAKAIANYYAALRLFEEIDNKFGISRSYNGLGSAYYHLAEYTKAIENYNKALVTCKSMNDKFGIASATDNIASVFFDEGVLDSANIYNLQAIRIFEEINHQPALGRIYFNRGNLMSKLHDAGAAYEYYMRTIAIDKKLGIKRGLATGYGGIGELYLALAKDSAGLYRPSPLFETGKRSLLTKAQSYLSDALSLSKEAGDISLMMEFANFASETQELLGNYPAALGFHKEYMLYKDSIFNDENKKRLAALETERLAEAKDKEIQLKASEVRQQTLIKNTILAGAGVAAVLAFVFMWSFNRRRKTMFAKQVMEVEMKALRSQMNPHFIFNSLNSINRYVVENDKVNASAYLSKFSNLMRLILENSREQEVPLEKDLNALELYMQLEALRFKNKFTYIIETDPEIDKENILIPPMLLQPFVENAIIHGIQNKEDGLIKINVMKENDMIKCVVEDNGIGRQSVIAIEPDGDKKHRSLGIKIIRERLNIINQLKKVKAAIRIFDLKDAENKPGGLRIELLLPLEQAF